MAVVLITGSSSGFGWSMAQEFANRGDEVYASVRSFGSSPASMPKLERSGSIQPLELDVTSGASIEEAVGAVLAASGRIDILVNNAGLHRLGAFEDLPESELRLMFETNFFGPVRAHPRRAARDARAALRTRHHDVFGRCADLAGPSMPITARARARSKLLQKPCDTR